MAALLLIALEAYLLARIALAGRSSSSILTTRSLFQAGVLLAVIALLPLVPWTLRNWRTFHRFQPLAPRYANEEDEFVPMGFNHWTKTWIADYASVEEIYWAVPGSEIDAGKLPSRAFDDPQQQAGNGQSDHRLQRHPAHHAGTGQEIRGHFSRARFAPIPSGTTSGSHALRIADMWLRPRTETLPSDSRWWEFDDEPRWSVLAIVLGVINCFVHSGCDRRMVALPQSRMAGTAASVCRPALGISGNAGKSRAAIHAGNVSHRNRARGRRAGKGKEA